MTPSYWENAGRGIAGQEPVTVSGHLFFHKPSRSKCNCGLQLREERIKDKFLDLMLFGYFSVF